MNYGKRKLPSSAYQISNSETDVGLPTAEPIGDETVKRKFRNLNEKKRRDQFNMLINELAVIVCPRESSKRLDKTSILEQAIQFLECHKESETQLTGDVSYSWKPSFLSHDEFIYLLLEAMDCITLALDRDGKINFLSDNAERKLGLTQELATQRKHFKDYIKDGSTVDNLLAQTDTPNGLFKVETLISSDPYGDTGRRFQAVDLLRVPDSDNGSPTSPSSSSPAAYNFVLQAKCPVLYSEGSAPPDTEFRGKYSLDWKILHLEQKTAAVLGYQPLEVLGTSGYDYYHPDDIESIAALHRKLAQSGHIETPLYRMLTKGQGWLWLKSSFYMTYQQMSGKAEHIECVHTVPSKREVDAFKKNQYIPADQSDTPPAVKRPRPNKLSTSGSAFLGQSTMKMDIFSANLSNGINRDREQRFGWQEPRAFPRQLLRCEEPPVLPVSHLSLAQQEMRGKLLTQYKSLKARLDNQHQELADLLSQLNLVSAADTQPSSFHNGGGLNPHEEFGAGGGQAAADIDSHDKSINRNECKQQ